MNIAEYLKLHEMSVQEFAEMIDCSPISVRNWKYGQPPNLATAVKIELATNGEITCKEILSKEVMESITNSLRIASTSKKPILEHSKKQKSQSKSIKKII